MELKGKKILVTGAGGFIGSHIVEDLLKEGSFVIALDIKKAKDSSIPKHLLAHPNFAYACVDIKDFDDLMYTFTFWKPDMVCHQAALVSVPISMTEPEMYLNNNVLGTQNIFELSRLMEIKKVVYASSSSIYGEASPYAYSKILDEKMAEMYNKLYNMEIIGLLYFNVYGPRQTFNGEGAVIPAFITAILNNSAVKIYGDGSQTRDFTFVRDVSQANIAALKYEGESRVFDIGMGNSTSINDLCDYLLLIFGKNTKSSSVYLPERPGDIRHSIATRAAFARFNLNWQPKMTISNGLRITCKAYSNE